jgi:hypothetical protein
VSQSQFWSGGPGNDSFNGPLSAIGFTLGAFGPLGSSGFNVVGLEGDDTISGVNTACSSAARASTISMAGPRTTSSSRPAAPRW